MDSPTTPKLCDALTALLPPDAHCSVTEITDDEWVEAEERVIVERAVASRRREFAAGRRCARAALLALGGRPAAIGRGPLGEPLWPDGYAGSITHGTHFAAAMARSSRERAKHGIDLVDDMGRAAFAEAASAILTDREARSLGGGPRNTCAIAQVFSAKEAAVKVVSPRLGRFVDFRELETWECGGDLIIEAPGYTMLSRSRWVGDVLLSVASTAGSAAIRERVPLQR